MSGLTIVKVDRRDAGAIIVELSDGTFAIFTVDTIRSLPGKDEAEERGFGVE